LAEIELKKQKEEYEREIKLVEERIKRQKKQAKIPPQIRRTGTLQRRVTIMSEKSFLSGEEMSKSGDRKSSDEPKRSSALVGKGFRFKQGSFIMGNTFTSVVLPTSKVVRRGTMVVGKSRLKQKTPNGLGRSDPNSESGKRSRSSKSTQDIKSVMQEINESDEKILEESSSLTDSIASEVNSS
jgi:hypothetical protein